MNAELLLEQFRARDLLGVAAPTAAINTVLLAAAVSGGGDDGNEGDWLLRAHLSTEKACLALAGYLASNRSSSSSSGSNANRLSRWYPRVFLTLYLSRWICSVVSRNRFSAQSGKKIRKHRLLLGRALRHRAELSV